MNLRALLTRFFRPERKIVVVRREETKLTLSEWQSDRDLVKLAAKVWANPDFRMMVSCLRNDSPANFVLPDDALPTRSIALQRRGEGYLMAITNLEAMARFVQPAELLEPTFEPEEPVTLNKR